MGDADDSENPAEMTVEIDRNSGFCFGVINAITRAEKELAKGEELFCLGEIVHNDAEVNRLAEQGLKTIMLSLIHIYVLANILMDYLIKKRTDNYH